MTSETGSEEKDAERRPFKFTYYSHVIYLHNEGLCAIQTSTVDIYYAPHQKKSVFFIYDRFCMCNMERIHRFGPLRYRQIFVSAVSNWDTVSVHPGRLRFNTHLKWRSFFSLCVYIKRGKQLHVLSDLCIFYFIKNTFSSYLLKFVGNHSKSLEDGVCRSSDGDDPLWTVAFRNIDSCSALEKQHRHTVSWVNIL